MSSAYDQLKSTLFGEIVRPGDEGYEYGIARWSDNSVQQAAYVVFPKNAEDVAAAIKFAKAEKVDIAVCGGGHSWSGSSSTTGLVIHLGKYLNTARCDPDAKLIYVGGGAVWEPVDKAGAEHGLATVAGTVNHTGVGGLVLGGGWGWLTGQHGLALDNLAQITIVLASGEIVTANETEHPDLFWGCRGGGSNFGVITEFVFKAHPQRSTVFFSFIWFPVDRLEEIVTTMEEWLETAGQNETCHWGYFRGGPGSENGEPVIRLMYFYNGPVDEARKAAKNFYDLGPAGELAFDEMPYVQLNSIQNLAMGHGGRKYCKGITVKPKLTYEAVKALITAIDESVKDEPEFAASGALFEFTPKQAVLSVPLDATAYAGRGTGRECLTFIFYKTPSLDSKARTAVRGYCEAVAQTTPVADRAGKGDDAIGVAYANYDPEPKGAALVFGPNYARLREVKRKYDPEGVFNKWYPIEPAAAA
ncbi:hypothetical protein FRC04_006724 [Tulasnella sp. 424]|nr:hypothetical protein FRC04_006724 [Tulasnella sp. 424]KAG8960591.1 hypothetical protein FRC05_006726 [Tulasnella sp. 425]